MLVGTAAGLGCRCSSSTLPSSCAWLRALGPQALRAATRSSSTSSSSRSLPYYTSSCLGWISGGSAHGGLQQQRKTLATITNNAGSQAASSRHPFRPSARTGTVAMASSSSSSSSNGGEAQQQQQPLSQRLWAEQAPLARAVLHHPFVRGIGQGTLREELFKGYAAQDAHFLKAFAKAYAHALTKAEDAHTIAELSACIASVVEELQLHASLGVAHHVQENSEAPPSPACEAYTAFLLRVARDDASTVAQVLAAMCPCMRLYAYLAQSLRSKLPAATRPESLQAWVDTYAASGFEEAAAKVEALLDREHAKALASASGGGGEDEMEKSLRELYARAMELEYDFFAEHWRQEKEGEAPAQQPWRGIDPGLLVTDFDSTCSREDTTHVLAKAAAHFKGPHYSPERWAALEQNYLTQLGEVLPPLLAPPDAAAHELAVADPGAYLAPLDAFEARLVDTVSDSGVLAGIAMDALPSLLRGALAPHLALQPHCAAVLRFAEARAAAAHRPAAFHVLSVSWCPDLIASATGLPRGTITCNSLQVDPATGLSTGRIQVAVDGPGGKLRHFKALRDAAHDQEGRPAVFIGDSITDLLALAAADVGLVVGQSQRLRQLAATLGCEVAPLVAYPIGADAGNGRGQGKERRRVLYEAEDWLDIAAALYGREAARIH